MAINNLTQAGAVTQVTQANFEKLVLDGGTVILDFWASWCGPCKMFGPIFEKVAAQHPDIKFGKVNTEEQPELAGAFGIRSIPTLMVFRDKIMIYQQPGALPEAAFKELIQKVQSLNMDEVRAEIAKHEKEHATKNGKEA